MDLRGDGVGWLSPRPPFLQQYFFHFFQDMLLEIRKKQAGAELGHTWVVSWIKNSWDVKLKSILGVCQGWAFSRFDIHPPIFSEIAPRIGVNHIFLGQNLGYILVYSWTMDQTSDGSLMTLNPNTNLESLMGFLEIGGFFSISWSQQKLSLGACKWSSLVGARALSWVSKLWMAISWVLKFFRGQLVGGWTGEWL